MKLTDVPLVEIFDFYNGKAIKIGDKGSIPIFGSNGIIGLTKETLYSDAIILGRVGAYCGSVMRCKENFWASDNTIVVKPKKNKADIDYCYYLLKNLRLNEYAGGAAQPLITQTTLKRIVIKIHDIDIQRRIAESLSVYDDLIENNQKQIKLFEEAAMRLYKEWFVYLRFPGYENTPIVEGVPDGWEPGRFKDLCTLVKETVKVKDLKIDMPYIGLEHMPRKSICLNEWSDASTVNSNKFRFKENDILFGKIRPYFHKVGFAITNGVASTDAMVFRAKDDMFGLALMTAFSDLFVKHTSTACKEGAKMPRADWNEMKNYEVLIPAQSVLKEYDRQIQSLCSNIKVLCQQVKLLKQARDKLLPKLMSGEIEV